MSLPSRLRIVALVAPLLAAGLGGCQALGGGGGVMPESDLGPPPSAGTNLPTRALRTSEVDEDGVPLPSRPTRTLELPKTVRGDTRTADTAGERRIRRDEIDGAEGAAASGSGGLGPSMQNGRVGMGGRF